MQKTFLLVALLTLTIACGGTGSNSENSGSLSSSQISGQGLLPTLEVEGQGQGGDWGGVGGTLSFAFLSTNRWNSQNQPLTATITCEAKVLETLPQQKYQEDREFCGPDGLGCITEQIDYFENSWQNLELNFRSVAVSNLTEKCTSDDSQKPITASCVFCGILPSIHGQSSSESVSLWCEAVPESANYKCDLPNPI